jgi:hypothetical protein
MGNICCSDQEEESEYARCIREHREANPELQTLARSSDWEPSAMSGPERERYYDGNFRYKNDIDERLKFTDKEFPPDFSSLIK